MEPFFCLQKNAYFFLCINPTRSNVLHSSTIISHFHKLWSVSNSNGTKNMHILASGPELQAGRYGCVILGKNWKKDPQKLKKRILNLCGPVGGVSIPLAVLGIVLGGALMRKLSISTRGSALMCTAAILMCMLTALPLLLLGCSTQSVTGVYPTT